MMVVKTIMQARGSVTRPSLFTCKTETGDNQPAPQFLLFQEGDEQSNRGVVNRANQLPGNPNQRFQSQGSFPNLLSLCCWGVSFCRFCRLKNVHVQGHRKILLREKCTEVSGRKSIKLSGSKS